jgi:ubiquinone/menaquinone biosynthesis C-methylase UbiE
MDHADHVELIVDGVRGAEGGAWADLGSGRGAFTLALAALLGPGGRIVSVDHDRGALTDQEREMRARFPDADVRYLVADFTTPLAIGPLDGVVMANSLHFVRRKEKVLTLVRGLLRPGGRLVLVEYDADAGTAWVPYPVSWAAWPPLARGSGFSGTRLIGRVPSRFLGAIYGAVSFVSRAST